MVYDHSGWTLLDHHMNSQFLPLDGAYGDGLFISLGGMWGDPRNDHFWWQCVFFPAYLCQVIS